MLQQNGKQSNEHLSLVPQAVPSPSLNTVPSPNPNKEVTPPASTSNNFDQAVILQQSPTWSRAIVWGIMGMTTFVIVWASVFQIEEAIPATGKLEPQGAVKEVQAPIAGVVKEIYVKDGQRVKKGDKLLSLDSETAQAQLTSLNKIQTALKQENQFYRSQIKGAGFPAAIDGETAQLKLPLELVSLTKVRSSLASENQLYRAQLRGSAKGTSLSLDQQQRFQSSIAELNSRVATARLEAEQLEKQLSQTQVEIASSKDLLEVNQGILDDIEPIMKQGAVSRVQYLKQKQDVRTRQAEVDQLTQEQKRLQLAIAQANEKLQNTIALTKQDLQTKIAENEKRLAEIDDQLNKAIVENNKRLAEIDSQMSQAEQNLKYQEIKAPVDGTIFELKPHGPGFVTNSTEPVLKIVPSDSLVAKVFITNKDIGFVKEGMEADIRIDSFPFREFGDTKGRLTWIGSDALPPEQIRPYYTFPAKVSLDNQSLLIKGREVPLQSGMSVSVNLKVRKRTIMSIFTDLFMDKVEGLKTVR
ncbi:HlyD family efflux transporter periplasmic adaptor subunit [Coleofasciculus sp. FACHB-SPT9]|uniref:HlyD family efflux transporter periplasmic adaptor subunit n=1 Tax=Cyanophyceae TaxID=3028117 RepID=UPI0016867B36|nr:HlyD family efflux transporter periplasmic adaptor subunit [Coleofasciculus sp. FACHB-SPT9]MBD1890705.1 HlyD family efflux transporter periplasmic adaptor subunit [Coleofasciculus sp. FACHB-SPT9]